ncbi:hypothetical protein C9993_08015 [Marinobacter sp. Z-F4-2]|nr:hypothetical protein C9993_08015 [Marinobacter sp. Z-F4-2]
MTNAIDVLWTGGWDSTFRVLFASLIEQKEVRPHYIIDFERKSSLRELQAISEIRSELRKLSQSAADRVGEIRITPITEIASVNDITESFHRLKKKRYLGSQYDWLSRYAMTHEITDLELSVHVDDKVYSFLEGKVDQDSFGRWKLRADENGDVNILACFTFPVLEISKIQMQEKAREFGFIDALEKSWFCFSPRSGEPCGECNPCIYTVEEGMGYRLSSDAIFRYKTRHLGRVLKTPVRGSRKLYRKITTA